MKNCFATVLAVLAVVTFSGYASAEDYQILTAPGTSKYLRDEIPEKSTPVDLQAAQNEYEAFQIIIRANKPVTSASVTASDLKSGNSIIPAKNIDLRLARYINLTEKMDWYRKGYYPDALISMPSSFAIDQGNAQMVWVNVYVPQNTTPGIYTGNLSISIDGKQEAIPVKLKVCDFALSVENHFGSAFSLWDGMLMDYYGKMDSLTFSKMKDRYYWFMTGYRMPPDDLPVPVDSPEAVKYLSDPRVTSYRIPYNPGQPDEFKKCVAYLREKGWLSKGYVYTIDEPPGSEFQNCLYYGKTIDSLAPDAKWLLTLPPEEMLYGAVDIWCANISNYNRRNAVERQAKGDKVWWYTAWMPQAPYPTYLVNDTAVSPRILSWFQSMYNVEGVLYWSINIWQNYDYSLAKYVKRDVWTEPMAFPNANGDGYLIYPGKTPADDPVPTLRLEMIRQGNEDFETLYVLQSRYADLAKQLGVSSDEYDPHTRVADIVGNFGASLNKWDADAELLEAVRRNVHQEIDSVFTGPKVLVSSSVPANAVTPEKTATIKLWAENGAKITAKLVNENSSQIIPLKFSSVSDKKTQKAVFDIAISSEPTNLVIQATKGSSTKTLTRVFRPYSKKPIDFKNANYFVDWKSQSDLKKWDRYNTDALLATDKQLGNCAKVTFAANVEFPSIQLPFPKGFTQSDWSKKGFIVVSAKNPNDFPVSFTIKIFDKSQKALDGFTFNMEPGEAKMQYCDMKVVGSAIDVKNLSRFELWSRGQPNPVSILVGPMATTTIKPVK